MRKYCKVDHVNGTKECPECGVVKPVGDFSFRSTGTIYPYCKPCNSARAGVWARANRERKNANENARRARKPVAKRRCDYYRLKLGVKFQDVLDLLEKQSFRCDICGCDICEKTMYVDHCHSEGHVRGLLCNRCNIGLASLERPGYLKTALEYLERHRSRS